jgi:hypothetical protein
MRSKQEQAKRERGWEWGGAIALAAGACLTVPSQSTRGAAGGERIGERGLVSLPCRRDAYDMRAWSGCPL